MEEFKTTLQNYISEGEMSTTLVVLNLEATLNLEAAYPNAKIEECE